MYLRLSLLLLLLLLLLLPVSSELSRDDFPLGFIFGSGTSAYQYEGAASQDGRSPSIWDTFAHSGQTGDANGDVTCDGYHKFEEDIDLMDEMGLDAFRFSISWSRLIPNGTGLLNPLGLQYYNNFIDKLIAKGIQPHVVLSHMDMPQILEDAYGGWRSRRILADFAAYADACFGEFGDRVKHWTTVNEANILSIGGYSSGILPPSRCSPELRPGCVGNSSTEPYVVGRNILLAHSAVWRLYQQKYKDRQNGEVGFNIYGIGGVPYDDTEESRAATKRLLDFYIAWLLDVLVFGEYPKVMEERVGERLPVLTKEESDQIKGCFDFIALNHYYSLAVKNADRTVTPTDFDDDIGVEITYLGSIYEDVPPDEFTVTPSGLSELLEYVKQRYGNPPVYIHENGDRSRRNGTLIDSSRIRYYEGYMGAVLDSIRNGSNVRGYFTWTLLDCIELLDGYSSGYGFYFVDLDRPNLPRIPKLSSYWYSHFLKGNQYESPQILPLR